VQRRDRVVAKTLDPAQGGDPDIAFAIFEDRGNEIAGESIGLRKYVGATLMEVHNTGSRGSNPDAAIAVPEKHYAIDVAGRSGVRILRFQFPAPESSEPSRQRNQKGSIVGLTQVLYRGRSKWHGIERGRAGPPSPNSVAPHHPEHVAAIFIQAICSVTEGAVRSIAANISSIDGTELSRRRQRVAADPNRSVAILKNRSVDQAIKVRVPGEFAISPARQAFHCADPESAVAGDMEAHDKIAGKVFSIRRRLPVLDADAVEPKQPEASAKPYVAVWRLRN
jgi:hypothetical protein